jgi:hypothetical protein
MHTIYLHIKPTSPFPTIRCFPNTKSNQTYTNPQSCYFSLYNHTHSTHFTLYNHTHSTHFTLYNHIHSIHFTLYNHTHSIHLTLYNHTHSTHFTLYNHTHSIHFPLYNHTHSPQHLLWGGLHGKCVVATGKGKTETILAFDVGPRKTKCMLRRPVAGPSGYWPLASRPANK